MPPREGGDEFSQAWKQEVKISKARRKVTHESGGLRNRVTIRVFTTHRDPVRLFRLGRRETIWAEVKGISGRELVAAGAEVAEATIASGCVSAVILPPPTA
jgi:hypothetical protein